MHVADLIVYPVKGCRGISLERAELGQYGIRHDRAFVIVDAESNEPISQINTPKMSIMATAIIGDMLRLSWPGADDFLWPLAGRKSGRCVDVTIWGETTPSVDQGEEVAFWLTECLKRGPVRLLRKIDGHARKNPLLVASKASLEELNARIGDGRALPMDRFRPNVVLDGMQAFEEDRLKLFRIGDVEFRSVKDCARCAYTTIDQATGDKDGLEPLKTLAVFRKQDRGVMFGHYYANLSEGIISIKDSLVPKTV